ncbi:MAG: amidohydrolase family protein [bacterium]|nr:amidohydrolase family protein [bacterium]
MIVDVHCHVGYSGRPVDGTMPRFSFEASGAVGRPGLDSYLSPRFLKRPAWRFVRHWMGIDSKLAAGPELDARFEAINQQHWSGAASVDRLVLLAFDEYHDDAGAAIGAAQRGQRFGSDLYVSNSLVRAMCAARPDRFLFGGSIHPYRVHDGRNACELLDELAEADVVLIKWLPIHQNIRADDPRTVAFLRRAAQLGVAMLIHYGGEMTLSQQHMEFESPVSLLGVLRQLRAEGAMPAVIVAHAATPSLPLQSAAGHRALVDALLGEFADAPLYADISALWAFGRRTWLRRLARRRELHPKLVWGSDYPIPAVLRGFRWGLDRRTLRQIAALPSWLEQSLRLPRALGFDECVFNQAAAILGVK